MNRQAAAHKMRATAKSYADRLIGPTPVSALLVQRASCSTCVSSEAITGNTAAQTSGSRLMRIPLNASSFSSSMHVSRRSCASLAATGSGAALSNDEAMNPEFARIAAYHIISILEIEPSELCPPETREEETTALAESKRRATQEGIPIGTFLEQMPDEVKSDVFRAGRGVVGWVKANPEWIAIVPGASIPEVEHVALSERGLASIQEEMQAFSSGVEDGEDERVRDGAQSQGAEWEEENAEPDDAHDDLPVFTDDEIEELVSMVKYHLKDGEYSSINSVRSAVKTIITRTQRKLGASNSKVAAERVKENELYNRIEALSKDQLIETLLKRANSSFWIIRDFICRRDGEDTPPTFRAPFANHSLPDTSNNYCGWAAAGNVPTRQDVYEILRYVPVNWGNMGNLSIPPDVKKAHIRINSTLQWFRRQPFYFEVRNIAGTLEIRRSCTLHPEEHGMTLGQAEERLHWKMANGTMNTLAPATPESEREWYDNEKSGNAEDGNGKRVVPLPFRSVAQWRRYRASVQPAPTPASAAAGAGAGSSTPIGATRSDPVARRPVLVSGGGGESAPTSGTTSTILKFLKRVAPGYFTTPGIILKRYTKKNLTEIELVTCALSQPDLFEVLEVPLHSTENARAGRTMAFPFFTKGGRDGRRCAVLLRRRTGADSTRWRDVFSEDLMRVPTQEELRASTADHGNSKVAADSATAAELDAERQRNEEGGEKVDNASKADISKEEAATTDTASENDVVPILIAMQHMCATWDRPLYLYVLLSDYERKLVGGYDGLCAMLRRHPSIFRCGAHFVCRADLSDPLQMREPELDESFATVQQARISIREDNPYLTPRELAVVFYHCCPDDNESTTVTYFVQCCSPAMYAVLPPRLITLLLLFPDLFMCREVSPGVFTVRKVPKRKPRTIRRLQQAQKVSTTSAGAAGQPPGTTGLASSAGNVQTGSGTTNGSAAAATTATATMATRSAADEEDYEDMDFAEDDMLSKEETIQAVEMLIPEHGVEASQLLLWVSMGVQKAASKYFGGVLKLVESRPSVFKVVDSTQGKTVYRQSQEKSSETK